MTMNLMLWKWSDPYNSRSKRRGLKFLNITNAFLEEGDHPAFGVADFYGFREALRQEFGQDEAFHPFVYEQYPECAVVNYPNAIRFELVPKVASIGKIYELNSSEF